MATEIERKFLLASEAWRAEVRRSEPMRQGYLAGPPGAQCSVRVRIAGEAAWLNIKSLPRGIVHDEYEYPIPRADAERMLETLAGVVVAKCRHHVEVAGHHFEIDEFEGVNAGLVVAEIELAAVDAPFARPPWLGPEVSHLARYLNIALAERPFRDWTQDERAGRDAC